MSEIHEREEAEAAVEELRKIYAGNHGPRDVGAWKDAVGRGYDPRQIRAQAKAYMQLMRSQGHPLMPLESWLDRGLPGQPPFRRS